MFLWEKCTLGKIIRLGAGSWGSAREGHLPVWCVSGRVLQAADQGGYPLFREPAGPLQHPEPIKPQERSTCGTGETEGTPFPAQPWANPQPEVGSKSLERERAALLQGLVPKPLIGTEL